MNSREFARRLRALNGGLVVAPGLGRVDGLYLRMPKHPSSNPESGLKHLGSIPSSRVFNTLPKYDFWDDTLGGFNRGWTSVLRYLTTVRFAGKPVIHRADAIKMFGDFTTWRHMAQRIEKTWVGKQRLKAKYPLQALPGSGVPLGQMAI